MGLLSTLSIAMIVIFALHAPSSFAAGSVKEEVAVSGFCPPTSCAQLTQAMLPNGSVQIIAKLPTGGSTKIGSVTLVISPLTLSDGKYHNTQTTTVKSTTGSLMNGVAVTMYENAGKSGGYFHGVTGPSKYPNGETIEHDAYPGPGSYTEWSSATWNGQTLVSVKITVVVP